MTRRYVAIEARGDVAFVWLENPPDQYFTVSMLPELAEACHVLENSPEVIIAIVASRHPDRFLGYLDPRDLDVLSENPGQFIGAVSPSPMYEVVRRLRSVPPLTIAAVGGHAWGAGCELALACDLRFMSDRSDIGLAMLEATLGLTPGGGASCRLRELVGRRAFHLLASARAVGPEEAKSLGLVDEIFPASGFLEAVLGRARELTFHTHQSIRNLRRCFGEEEVSNALAQEEAIYLEGLQSPTVRERVRALVEYSSSERSRRDLQAGMPRFLLEPVLRRNPRLLIQALTDHFEPERAQSASGSYVVGIDGSRGGTWKVRVCGGELSITPGDDERADVAMHAAPDAWLDFVTGEVGDVELFVSGRIRVQGELTRALEFKSFFLGG